MKNSRLASEDRQKQLRLAITRIERGRSQTKARKLTISSVAREAGVSTSLIHNHHPEIAEVIREKQGRSSRAMRDAKQSELKAEREKNQKLRSENAQLRQQIAKLASVNELLTMNISSLEARMSGGNVIDHPSAKK
jgi:phage-related minor tail protein